MTMSLQNRKLPLRKKLDPKTYDVGRAALAANGYVVVHRDNFPYTSPNDYTINWAFANVHL